MSDHITATEAAQILGYYSTREIKALVDSGTLKAERRRFNDKKNGVRYSIKRSDVEELKLKLKP